MKFYVHCEDPTLTTVIVWENDKPGTVQDIVNIFQENLEKKYPLVNKCVSYTVGNSKGKEVALSSSVCRVVRHMDDLFVKRNVDDSKKKTENVNTKIGIDRNNKGEAGKNSLTETSKEMSEKEQMLVGKNNAALIHFGNQRYRKAISIYKEMLMIDLRDRSAITGLITCYFKAGRNNEALSYTKKGLTYYQDDSEFLFLAGQCHVAIANADDAIQCLLKHCKIARRSGGTTKEDKHDVQVLLAKAYLLKDQKDMAIAILQGVLRENIEHHEALVEYAALLFQLGPSQSEEAMSTLLTALARRRTDKNAMEKFACVCRQPNGMHVLKNVAGSALKDVNALVFLATCLRDCSAIQEALDLLEMAMDLDSKNPNTVLTYIHTLELLYRHKDIMFFYKKYMLSFPDVGVGQLNCAVIYPIISVINDNLEVEERDIPQTVTSLVAPASKYSEVEQYFLALLFTLVKILYIKGLLPVIPPLLELITPFCQGRQLHLTNIRNEAAYFSCIEEVFKSYDEVPSTCPASTADKFLYFVGDSHCIPVAWQKVLLNTCLYGDEQSADFTLYPVLSTGTKIWHLRPESTFYPKVNFNSAIKVIPDGAKVVVCLGEIDCREAFLKCWEKARYETIEDAMATVVEIYLQLLKSLQQEHEWTILIHPVLPVLDVTRPIVLQFNRILATKLLTEPSLHWLNFVNELLTPDGSMLKEEFKIDGTHMHPKYVSLLTEALSQYF